MIQDHSMNDDRVAVNSPCDNLNSTDSKIDCLIQENFDLHSQLSKKIIENKELANQLRRALDQIRELEQSNSENREIYLLAIEATNLGIYDTKVEDHDFSLKENWLARLGYDPILARDQDITWENLIHPDDHDRVLSTFAQELKGEIDSLVMEYRLRDVNGNYRWIIESSKRIGTSKENGKLRIVGTHYDITARKMAEEAQREQQIFTDALISSTNVFNSTLDLDKLIYLILTYVGRVVPSDDSDVWLIDKKKMNVFPAPRKDMEGNILSTPSVVLPIDDIAIFKEIVHTGKHVYLPDIKPNNFPIPSRNANSRSCLCLPVMFGDYLLGFLVLNSSRKNFYTSTHLQRLQAFVNQAAVAIRNAQLYTQAQEAAALEERQRLARDMHDVISQTLFSATIKAEVLPYLLESEPPEVLKENLRELHRLTRGALAEMRTMLMELRPNTIVNTDFGNLLTQMVEGLAGRTTANIELSANGVGLLPPDVQTAFFRISQESINNILKHSKAKQISIQYINRKEDVTLSINDNGCGFDPAKVPAERMGLRIMRERADSIRAKLYISSQPGKGSKVQILWKKTIK